MHPVWMLAALSLAGLALRSGLRLRRARRTRTRCAPDALARHLRFAKPALVMLLIGFGLGLASSVWLRGWDALGSAHAKVALAALALLLTTGFVGRRLETGRVPREMRAAWLERHAALALLSTFAAAAAFGTGFVLLP